MKKVFFVIALSLILSAFFWTSVFAHPGRTDSSGCHTCRTNCPNWGLDFDEYHCHQAKVLPQSNEPIHSRYGEGGTGYTIPAPEYKKSIETESKKKSDQNTIVKKDVVNSRSIIDILFSILKKRILGQLGVN